MRDFEKEKAKETKGIARFKGGASNFIRWEDIKDEEVVVTGFKVGTNRFDSTKEVCDVTVELNGETFVWSTSSSIIRRQLEETEEFPFVALVTERRSKGGTTYKTFAPPAEEEQ